MNTENLLNEAKQLSKNLRGQESYKLLILTQILKNGTVDTAKLKKFGEENNKEQYVQDVFMYSEELEDNGYLVYNSDLSRFNFVNDDKKQQLYNYIYSEIESLKTKQNAQTSNSKSDNIVYRNKNIQEQLRQSYESLQLDTIEAREKFLKSITYFNNFSFNNIINLHAQQIEREDDFSDNVRFYKTFGYFASNDIRVQKGSKALKAFVPKRVYLDEVDENGNKKYATSFVNSNIFEFSQTNFDIDYLDADKITIAQKLSQKSNKDFPLQEHKPENFISNVCIKPELEKLSDSKEAIEIANSILLNRLGIENHYTYLSQNTQNYSKDDFLTLVREAHELSKSYERKYNFDEILKESVSDEMTLEEILINYEDFSREKKIKHSKEINKVIDSRVLKIKEELGGVSLDFKLEKENNLIVGLSVNGVKDNLNTSIEDYIEEIKDTEEYKEQIEEVTKKADYFSIYEEIENIEFGEIDFKENEESFKKLFKLIKEAREAKDTDMVLSAYMLDSNSDKSQMIKDLGYTLNVDPVEVKRGVWFDATNETELPSQDMIDFIVSDYTDRFLDKYLEELSIEYMLTLDERDQNSEEKDRQFREVLESFRGEYFDNQEYDRTVEQIKEHIESGEFATARKLLEDSKLDSVDKIVLGNYYERYINVYSEDLDEVKNHIDNQIKLDQESYAVDDESEYKATLEFNSPEQANDFATAYSRRTLRGHTVSENKVEVYGLTEDDKSWVSEYVSNINKNILDANEEVQFDIVDRYMAISNFSRKENFLINESEPNEATLNYLLNDATDNEEAELIRMLLNEYQDEDDRYKIGDTVILNGSPSGENTIFARTEKKPEGFAYEFVSVNSVTQITNEFRENMIAETISIKPSDVITDVEIDYALNHIDETYNALVQKAKDILRTDDIEVMSIDEYKNYLFEKYPKMKEAQAKQTEQEVYDEVNELLDLYDGDMVQKSRDASNYYIKEYGSGERELILSTMALTADASKKENIELAYINANGTIEFYENNDMFQGDEARGKATLSQIKENIPAQVHEDLLRALLELKDKTFSELTDNEIVANIEIIEPVLIARRDKLVEELTLQNEDVEFNMKIIDGKHYIGGVTLSGVQDTFEDINTYKDKIVSNKYADQNAEKSLENITALMKDGSFECEIVYRNRDAWHDALYEKVEILSKTEVLKLIGSADVRSFTEVLDLKDEETVISALYTSDYNDRNNYHIFNDSGNNYTILFNQKYLGEIEVDSKPTKYEEYDKVIDDFRKENQIKDIRYYRELIANTDNVSELLNINDELRSKSKKYFTEPHLDMVEMIELSDKRREEIYQIKAKEEKTEIGFALANGANVGLSKFHPNTNAYGIPSDTIKFSSQSYMTFGTKEEALSYYDYMKNAINEIETDDSNITNIHNIKTNIDDMHLIEYEQDLIGISIVATRVVNIEAINKLNIGLRELIDNPDALQKHYPTMSYDEKIEYSDLLDSRISERTVDVYNQLDLDNRQEWLDNTVYQTNRGGFNNIGYTAFGVQDNFQDINEFVDEIKNSQRYIDFIASKENQSEKIIDPKELENRYKEHDSRLELSKAGSNGQYDLLLKQNIVLSVMMKHFADLEEAESFLEHFSMDNYIADKGYYDEDKHNENTKQAEQEGYVGKNIDGYDIYEDDKGVRSYIEPRGNMNISVTEPIGITPNIGIETDNNGARLLKGRFDYLTQEEIKDLSSNNDLINVAENHIKSQLVDMGYLESVEDNTDTETAEEKGKRLFTEYINNHESYDADFISREYDKFRSLTKPQSMEDFREHLSKEHIKSQKVQKKEHDIQIETEKIGAKTKFRRNVEALAVIEKLEAGVNSEDLTKEEITTLSKYTGWGGIPQAFRKLNGEVTNGWEKEVAELEELLPESKIEEIRRTILTSFYTPTQVVDGIVKAIEDMGYNGYGNILEPSVGIGNIVSRFTTTLKKGSKIDAIEMDKTTSSITKALFPNVNVTTSPFQDVEIKDNKYNLIIGNPPFGDLKINDSDKDINQMSLHNYFMARSSKKLAEGGIMSMVVSSHFMDSSNTRAREVIADSCNLVGAIRLPNNAFGDTEVTTDVLFFQKRTSDMESNRDSWVDVSELNETQINKYYVDNQENLLGKWGKYGTMYGGGQSALVADKEQDTIKLFNERLETFPKDIYSKNQSSATILEDLDETSTIDMTSKDYERLSKAKDYSYVVVDDKLIMKISTLEQDYKVKIKAVDTKFDSKGEKVELKDTEIERIKAIVGVVESAERLRDAQLSEDATDEDIAEYRQDLNNIYDKFVKKYKYLNADTNKRYFKDDTRYAFALSLEKDYTKAISKSEAEKKGLEPRAEKATKADIFIKRTQTPYKIPTKADNSLDALTISLSEKGRIDLRYMSTLTGFSEDKMIDELVVLDEIFLDHSEGWVTKAEYLSGNVKAKLKVATEPRNIEALKAVIPKDLQAHEIVITCGATWLPEKYMSDFVEHIAGSKSGDALYIPSLASWKLSCEASTEARIKYATERRTLAQILEASANNAQIKVYDKQIDGSMKLNEAQSQLANDKVEQVREEFKRWIFQDDDRRNNLVHLYNEKFNTDVERSYDGDILPLRGKSDTIELRKHQKDFVRKFVEGKGVNLADHTVGTGKTFTAQACVMEAKRIGRANKALVVVPNHLTEQWGREWLQLYPNANILVATKKDFSTKERPIFLNRIATGEWDAVVIGHSQLEKIGTSKEFQKEFLEDQKYELLDSLKALEEKDGKSFTTKQIENKISKLEERLKQVAKKEVETTLEELGIDMTVVDEAHEFKNLAYTTGLTSVGSLGNPSGSKKAEDLFVKTRSLLQRTNNTNLLFLTGTPISNTIAEMYTMQRYLQYDRLQDLGLTHFDSWAKQFAEVVTEFELKQNGNFEPKARLSKFNNIPELMQLYKSFADVVTREEVIADALRRGEDLKIPKVKGGRATNVVLDRSDLQATMIGIEDDEGNYNAGSLIDRAIKIQGKKPEKGADNILKIIGEAKKVALDPRIIDPNFPDNPNSKVNVMIEHSLELYNEFNEDKGAMLIFCDLSTPKGSKGKEREALLELYKQAESEDEAVRIKAEQELDKISSSEIESIMSENDFSVYDDIKEKLIAKGIPENEIAFIHDANTNVQKQALFQKVKNGDVRYLLGSTSKMGAGMNVQDRLVGLFHLDAPWRPSDIEQREGRIIRQGNKLYEKYGEDFSVTIERYATKGTLDSTMWETLERKQLSIEQIKAGVLGERSMEDISGESATMSDMKASSSGNPFILEEVKLKKDIKKIENLKTEHDRLQYSVRDKIRLNKQILEKAENEFASIDIDTTNSKKYIDWINTNKSQNEIIEEENKRIKAENKDIQKENKSILEKNKNEGEALPVKDLLEEKELLPVFKASINGVEFFDREKMGERIEEIINKFNVSGARFTKDEIKFGDFSIIFEKNMSTDLMNRFINVVIEGKNEYIIDIPADNFSGRGVCTRIVNKIERIEKAGEERKADIEYMRSNLPALERSISDFEREDELKILRKRYELVTNALKYKKDDYHQAVAETFTIDKIESGEDMPKIFTVSFKDGESNIVHAKNLMADNEDLARALYRSVLSKDNISIENDIEVKTIIDGIEDKVIKIIDDSIFYKDVKIEHYDPFYNINDYAEDVKSLSKDKDMSRQDTVHDLKTKKNKQ